MKKSIITFFCCALAACLISSGCRKPDDEPKCQAVANGPGCQPIPTVRRPNLGYEFVTEGRELTAASYNPNNDDEFVFLSSYASPIILDTLFVYTRSTGQIRKILEAKVWYPPVGEEQLDSIQRRIQHCHDKTDRRQPDRDSARQ